MFGSSGLLSGDCSVLRSPLVGVLVNFVNSIEFLSGEGFPGDGEGMEAREGLEPLLDDLSSQNFHPPDRLEDLAGESIRKFAGESSLCAVCDTSPTTHFYDICCYCCCTERDVNDHREVSSSEWGEIGNRGW